jgi:hypothetical protein
MPAIYHEILAGADPMKVYARNVEHIEILSKRLNEHDRNKGNISGRQQIQFNLACEFLYAGRTKEGIELFEKLEKDTAFVRISKIQRKDSKGTRYDSLKDFIALSYLRLGEETNCINSMSNQACIFPLNGGGIHQMKQPAEEAIKRYLALLQGNPEDYISQWCLNVAVQALGSVPDYVPKKLLIDSSLLESDYNIKSFKDVAMYSGISNTGLAGGIVADDFDNDGYIDVMSSTIELEGQMC